MGRRVWGGKGYPQQQQSMRGLLQSGEHFSVDSTLTWGEGESLSSKGDCPFPPTIRKEKEVGRESLFLGAFPRKRQGEE